MMAEAADVAATGNSSKSGLLAGVPVEGKTTPTDEVDMLDVEQQTGDDPQQDAAVAAISGMGQDQRLQRLTHLLEKSKVYSDFLATRMQQQMAERKEKEAKAAKRAEKKKAKQGAGEAAATGATASPSRRSSSRSATRSSSSGAAQSQTASASAAANPAATQPRQKKRKSQSQDLHTDQKAAAGPEMEAEEIGKFLGTLRDYQEAGVEWIRALWMNGLNGILADEMGLGKTVQCIGFLAHLYAHKIKGPFLVVGPLSTLSNWDSEFKRFTPNIPSILYHGTPAERADMRTKIMGSSSRATVVTSYEIVIRDRKFLSKLPWQFIIVDEGHRLKNMDCRLVRELKTYKSANRLLLTGTPLQNNLSELWSLLNFLMPDIFDDLDSFQRWFDFEDRQGDHEFFEREKEQQVVTKLHDILKPFLLRRLKTDVDLTIPPKREIVLYPPMTPKQQEDYKSILDKTLLSQIERRISGKPLADDVAEAVQDADGVQDADSVQTGDAQSQQPPKRLKRRRTAQKKDYRELSDREYFQKVEQGPEMTMVDASELNITPVNQTSVVNLKMRNIIMQLRKCCNHPYLLEYPLTPDGQYRIDEDLVNASGKMRLLDRMLPELKKRGHKVLIFSQFTSMLDVIQDYCWLRKYDCCRLDGNVSLTDRKEQMRAFNTDPEMFLFLLSTRAGGLGINLVSADTVIVYDSDWNPQVDLQAQDRCHRIGQDKPVMVYRFITANTIDQRILERAEAKRKLEKVVIHKHKFKGNDLHRRTSQTLTSEDLLQLLQSDDREELSLDNHPTVLSDAELERVLDRSLEQTFESQSGLFQVVDNEEPSNRLF